MTINFEYSGDVSYLTAEERKALAKGLKACTRPQNWDYFEISRKELTISGSYDNKDGYRDDHKDIEWTLNKYDVNWTGGGEEYEFEPDWDKMPGGVDYGCWNNH